jgi:hypothetical protein
MDPGPGLQVKSHWRRQPGRRRGSHINTGQIRNRADGDRPTRTDADPQPVPARGITITSPFRLGVRSSGSYRQ